MKICVVKKFVSRLTKNKFSIGGLIGVHVSRIEYEVIEQFQFFTKKF